MDKSVPQFPALAPRGMRMSGFPLELGTGTARGKKNSRKGANSSQMAVETRQSRF